MNGFTLSDDPCDGRFLNQRLHLRDAITRTAAAAAAAVNDGHYSFGSIFTDG